MIWKIFGVILFLFLYHSLNDSQRQQMKKTMYSEKTTIDGVPRTVQKLKCPHCGNKNLDIQLLDSPTLVHATTKKTSTVYSSTSKRAVCNKCGASFDVVTKVTPFSNFIVALVGTPLVYLLLYSIYLLVSIFLGH